MRFFLEDNQVKNQKTLITGADARHIATVLRQQPGDELFLVWREMGYRGRIQSITPEGVVVSLDTPITEHREAPLDFYLLQGLAKGERMELVIQKGVELGVKGIIPVSCRYSVVQLSGKKAEDRRQRWQKIAQSAAKQCGRLVVPDVYPISTLAEAFALLPPETKIVMPWERTVDVPLSDVLHKPAPKKAALVIGPEGGFSLEEAEFAVSQGASLVTLGERILRTETAAIATMAIVMYQWGDLGVG